MVGIQAIKCFGTPSASKNLCVPATKNGEEPCTVYFIDNPVNFVILPIKIGSSKLSSV